MPPKNKNNHEDDRCSFCGKTRAQVQDMFDGPGGNVRICDQCIALCNIMMIGQNLAGFDENNAANFQAQAPEQMQAEPQIQVAAPTKKTSKFSN